MRRRIYLWLITLAVTLLPVYANAAEKPYYEMCSTSSTLFAATTGCVTAPFADRPEYMTAASGDMNPFGASASANSHIRKGGGRPGKTDGDTENPNIDAPLTDGLGVLLCFALLFAGWKWYRKNRYLAKQNVRIV